MSIADHPTLLRDAFVYFAKFPLQAGMLKVFKRNDSKISGYSTLKSELEALTVHSLVSGIVNYVFAQDEDTLKKQIEDTNGPFLFLDYGTISSGKDGMQRVTDTMDFALIVAEKFKPEGRDAVEMVLKQDELLNYLRTIREQMIYDQKCSPFVKELDFPHKIDPWYARDMQNATGWAMVFSRSGIGLL